MTRRRRPRSIRILGAGTVLLLLVGASPGAWALTRSSTDPSDAPNGVEGRTDLRAVTWTVNGSAASLTVTVDESTYGAGQRASLGVHLLIDNDLDGLADAEVVASRNADGVKVDVALRLLDRTLSTSTCQDLDGKASGQLGTVSTQVASGLETFSFSFDAAAVPGGLGRFRWAAFGQSPFASSAAGPWDYLPESANPEPLASNPGDRRCDSSLSGLKVIIGAGIDFAPDPTPVPGPGPTPGPATATCPGHETDARNQVVGTPGRDTLAGTPGDDVICGLGGSDRITGAAGDDMLVGGVGRDRLDGGGGRDSLTGGSGADTMTGGPGNDRCHGGGGRDTVSGCES
jgi:hypothetical protein